MFILNPAPVSSILLKVSYATPGSTQLDPSYTPCWVSCVSRVPTQPPCPTSSSKFSQFISPASTCSLQTLGSSSDTTLLCGFAFRSPAPPSQKDPLAPRPAVDPVTSPWPVDQLTLPWLLSRLYLRQSTLRVHLAP